jgi:hypothetical protein
MRAGPLEGGDAWDNYFPARNIKHGSVSYIADPARIGGLP